MRFQTLVGVLPRVHTLAEVGCDHAKLTELAFVRGLCERAVVSDIASKCLDKAKRTLARFGDKVVYVLCDGIPPEAKDADLIMICGMGGHTIEDILSRYDGDAKLLLSPQSHAERARSALTVKGYRITRDECFKAAGKYYDLMTAEKGNMTLTDMQLKYGAFYTQPTEALAEKLEKRLDALLGGGEKTAEEAAEIREVLGWRR